MEAQELERALAHPTRRRLYEAIRARPGISISEAASATRTYWTAAALHVAHLVQAGHVWSLRAGRRRLLFPTGASDDGTWAARSLLAEPACRRVALAIIEHPGLRVYEICDLLGMSERAVYHHLKRLAQAELVATRTDRGYRDLQATPRLLAILAQPA